MCTLIVVEGLRIKPFCQFYQGLMGKWLLGWVEEGGHLWRGVIDCKS